MSQSGDKIRKPLVSKSSFNSSKSGSEFEIVRSLFGIFWSENICTVFRVYLIRMLSYYAGKDSAVCKSKSLSFRSGSRIPPVSHPSFNIDTKFPVVSR